MNSLNTVPITVTPMSAEHWLQVQRIYQAGIASGHATFAEAPPPSWDAWRAGHLNDLSIVSLLGKVVSGWASLAPVSGRQVYAGVAEVSIYVAREEMGRGFGRQLLTELIRRSEANNFWTLQAGVFPENTASLALHRGGGFRPVGVRQRLGKMTYGPLAGRWRDVLLLERRSACVGAEYRNSEDPDA